MSISSCLRSARSWASRRATRPRTLAGIPVCPGAWPLVGHLPAALRDLPGLFQTAARALGPVFWVDMGFGHRYVVCVDAAAFELFKNKQATSVSLAEVSGRLLGRRSLIGHDGAVHRHMRSALNPPFTPRGLSAAEVGGIFAEVIEQHVAVWLRTPAIALLPQMRELTLALLFRMLGIRDDAVPAWREHYEEFLLAAIDIPIDLPGLPRWRSRRAQGWLDEHLLMLVTEARARPPGPGLVSQLAHARDQDGEPLLDVELLDNLRLLVLAGHETTAAVLAWMVLHLARDPALWAAVRDEAVAAPVPRAPRELRQFPLAEGLFREALRLHPPVTITSRRALEPLELCGHTIAAGIDVMIPIVCLTQDPGHYPEPDVFRVERWLGRAAPPTPIETAPFGGGSHFCLGYHAAVMEGVQAVVILARALATTGRRPDLVGPWPRARHFPLGHPDPRAKVTWRPAGAHA